MKHKVLIVDDDEAIRTQMKWALNQDYDIDFAEDRTQALKAFKANAPAVTLLDLGLPPHPNESERTRSRHNYSGDVACRRRNLSPPRAPKAFGATELLTTDLTDGTDEILEKL